MHSLYHLPCFETEDFVSPLEVSGGPKVDTLVGAPIHGVGETVYIVGKTIGSKVSFAVLHKVKLPT